MLTGWVSLRVCAAILPVTMPASAPVDLAVPGWGGHIGPTQQGDGVATHARAAIACAAIERKSKK